MTVDEIFFNSRSGGVSNVSGPGYVRYVRAASAKASFRRERAAFLAERREMACRFARLCAERQVARVHAMACVALLLVVAGFAFLVTEVDGARLVPLSSWRWQLGWIALFLLSFLVCCGVWRAERVLKSRASESADEGCEERVDENGDVVLVER